MATFLFMIFGVNVQISEIMLIMLALFVVFLLVRNVIMQQKKANR